MATLFDILANAQNGQGLDLLARQFNLTRQQTELALEALLPAFSQGLKRTVSDPFGIAGLMNALAFNQYGQYFDQASRAFSPAGVATGNDVLGQLFGTKDLSRALASQAAQATGIGEEILKQMLPVIASMLMGGMFKQWTGQLQPSEQASGIAAGNPLGEIIEQMMIQGGLVPGQQPRQQDTADPFDNPFGKALKDMFGSGTMPGARQPTPGGPENPFGKMLDAMLGARRNAPPTETGQDTYPQPRANPSGRPRNPYDDIFDQMFETGRKTRDEYQKGVEDIFEQFRRGMDQQR